MLYRIRLNKKYKKFFCAIKVRKQVFFDIIKTKVDKRAQNNTQLHFERPNDSKKVPKILYCFKH